MSADYTALARYYDLENAAFTADLDFWLELAANTPGPILEIGCGTGRVLLPLAQHGHSLTGVDNAPAMLARLQAKLERARRHLKRPPTLLEAEMTAFRAAETAFGLVIVPFNTFTHLHTLEQQLAALTCWRAHLRPGGMLALDMPNPAEAYAAPEQGLTLERTFADGERTVHQFSSLRLDRAGQMAHILWLYDSVGPAGDLHRLAVPLTLRYTFPAELRLLLERAGFRLAHLYGDYDASPLADGAPRVLALAEAV